MDGSKPPDWTGFPPANSDIPTVTNDRNEIQPDVFGEWISAAIENEYSTYGDSLASPWVRELNREDEWIETQIQDEISAEDDREYMNLVRRLRRTTRQINEITNSGIFDENITDLIYMRTSLRQQIAQIRMNPRIDRTNARAFQNYVRDQR